MRVLFEGDDLHAWLPSGSFTLHADGQVTWRTPYAPLTEYASAGDYEPHLPPALDGRFVTDGVSDALLLEDGRVVIARSGEAPRVDVVALSTGAVELSAPLEGDGPRLPGLRDEEEWQDGVALFSGYGPRAIRLFACEGGFLVTANESGHVALFSLAERRFTRVLRVPGAPENEVYAARVGDDLLVGMKWNHRHSDLFLVAPDGTLRSRWPAAKDEVRWGMPTPAVLGRHVLTYSDEGPHSGCLALLALPSLEEVELHAPLASRPEDLCTHGRRFAAASKREVTLGHVEGGKIVVDRVWKVGEAMRAAGVEPPPRPKAATDDGRGTRSWLEDGLDFLGVDRGVAVVRKRSAAIVALEQPERVLVPAPEKPRSATSLDALLGPAGGARPLDVFEGGLLVERAGALVRLDLRTGSETGRLPVSGRVLEAKLLPGGVLHVDEDSEDHERRRWRWSPFGGEARELSRSGRAHGGPNKALVRASGAGWWFEYDEDVETMSEEVDAAGVRHVEARVAGFRCTLCRWSADAGVRRIELGRMVEAFAASGEVAYVVTEGRTTDAEGYYTKLLQRVGPDGSLTRVSREPLPTFVHELVVAGEQAFVLEPLSTGRGIYPSKIWSVSLTTGERRLVATASVGSFAQLSVDGDRLFWLEANDDAMAVFDIGAQEPWSAVCVAPLPL